MKHTMKFITGIFMTVFVIGAITLLAIKYFDVLMKIFEDIKSQFSSKRPRFVADACCDCCDEEYYEDEDGE